MNKKKVDVIVIGAGFAGLYALYKLREQGCEVKVFEKGSDVGGTWLWNQYPGCRCDVESLEYSYSFSEKLQQEWEWPEKYSSQADILNYAKHVTERFNLRKDIIFNTKIVAANFDKNKEFWELETDTGAHYCCTFCVMATGNLSEPQLPNFEGLDNFQGDYFHTGLWPNARINFSGKRVALIGTGSSGIQAAPEVAKEASELFIFQRTANFSVPARNHASNHNTVRSHKAEYKKRRNAALETPFGVGGFPPPTSSALEVTDRERNRIFEEKWQEGGTISFLYSFTDLLTNAKANYYASEFVRNKIRNKVNDKSTAELLCPNTHPIGTKRLVADNGYYEIFNQDNVKLIDISSRPIEKITKTGLRTKEKDFDVDIIIFALGFDAMTGAINSINIRNKNGDLLANKWKSGPRTYLGLMTADFPNLFLITGPQSPGVKSQMILSIEQHVDWISRCIDDMQCQGYDYICPSASAEEYWVNHNTEVASKTLYPLGGSWYQGANIKGKTKVFMPYVGGFDKYKNILNGVVKKNYEGFTFK